MNNPDLTEEIVTGRTEFILTGWGMRHDDCLHDYGHDEKAARQAAADHARVNGKLVRRTVSYGPWEEVPLICDSADDLDF
jgi:hypothetical protein